MLFALQELSMPLKAVLGFVSTFAIVLAIVAIISPRAFTRLSTIGGYWIDTSRFFSRLDARVDVDNRILPHCRLLGASVLGSLGLLSFVLFR